MSFKEYIKSEDSIGSILRRFPELKNFQSSGSRAWYTIIDPYKANEFMGYDLFGYDNVISARDINLLLNKIYNEEKLSFEF